jgi:PAS domain S-box-containing protein
MSSPLNQPRPVLGFLSTLSVLAAIQLLTQSGVEIPNPGILMSLAVVFAIFVGGVLAGTISVIICLAYLPFYLSEPGTILTFNNFSRAQLVVVYLALPTIATMVITLKRALYQGARAEGMETGFKTGETSYYQLVEAIQDYGILKLDPKGIILSMNQGAQKINGYRVEEVIGQHFSKFYPPEDITAGKTEMELREAAKVGRFEDEGWRVKKDGSRFWANVIITALRDPKSQELQGYVKVTRDLTERKRQEEELRESSVALAAANRELEAFSYSVSHDLRAPLRGIDGFSQALMEDFHEKLNEDGRDYLNRIRAGTQRMGKLIDDLLTLSRLGRTQIRFSEVDLSELCERVVRELSAQDPKRKAEVTVQPGMKTRADPGLITAVMQNLISNAWKFTSKKERTQIEIGSVVKDDETVYFVKDNGAGFDMKYSDKLFGAFQRLHRTDEFAGTGVGLATVRRVIHRHGGKIWVEAKEGEGATFYFTLGTAQTYSSAA